MTKLNTPVKVDRKISRNDPCLCGSGKKYKKCCINISTSIEKTGENINNIDSIPRCRLCGKTSQLTKTECCDNWICNDEYKYVVYSYARNSCLRNHWRYTLCGYHHVNGHTGNWKDCNECLKAYKTEMYVYMGTNEYNFEKLENPPQYEPTECSKCGKIIKLGEDGYSSSGSKYLCEKCTNKKFFSRMNKTKLIK